MLVVDPGGLAPFGPAKWLAVSALVVAGAATVLGRPHPPLPRRLVMAWGAFLLVAGGAAAFGVDRVYAWTGTPERHLGWLTWGLCALAFATARALRPDERSTVMWVAVAACGLAGTWAVAEAVGWHPIALVGAGNRPVGPFGSSAYLGAALALLAPIAVGLASDTAATGRARRLAAAAAVAGGAGLVVSGARAAWVGVAVAAVVVAVMRRRLPWRTAVAAAVLAVVIAVATGVAGRLPDVVTDRNGGARGRLDEWRVAARVVAHRPLLGVGPEGYRIAFGRAVDDGYERAHGRDPLPDRAHSAVLDVAATTGVLGLAAYAALVLAVGAYVVRTLRAGSAVHAGLAAGLVAYAAQSLFLFPIGELEPVVWLLAGLVVAHATRTGREHPVPHGGKYRPVRVAGALAGALVAAAALVAGGLDVAADHAAKAALATGRDPTRAASLRPDQIRYRLVAARALAPATRPAVRQLDHALAVSPRDPVVRTERARLLLVQARQTTSRADAMAARDALAALSRDDPRNAEVLLRLGVADELLGDHARAERAWTRAEHLAPHSAAASVDLAVLYAEQQRWPQAERAARRALQRDPHNAAARGILERHGT
ncbi:MAG: hypothetical protein QOE35_1633 [Actinomycetota bacterium]|jgi:O-antigen ligase/Flp pilus assembly protein TadD